MMENKGSIEYLECKFTIFGMQKSKVRVIWTFQAWIVIQGKTRVQLNSQYLEFWQEWTIKTHCFAKYSRILLFETYYILNTFSKHDLMSILVFL